MPMAPSRAIEARLGALAAGLLLPTLALADIGRVIATSPTRAYLDRGAASGLEAGMTIPLRRGNDLAGHCVVEEVAEHFARCRGAGARVGDRFKIAAPPARKEGAAPSRLTVARAPEELAKQREALVAAPLPKVAFAGHSAMPVPASLQLKAEAGYSHTSWLASGMSGFNGERVDVHLRGVPLASGLRFWADLTAVQWLSRPDTTRYRPGASTQLFVWEAAIASRETDRPYAFAVGRVIPWHVPGIAVFDGGQAAWRSASGHVEIGVFGGELPKEQTIAFQQAWLAGGYWSYERLGSLGSTLRVFRHEARIALLDGVGFPRRLELEGVAQASLWHHVDAGIEAKLAWVNAQGASLAAARADVAAKPLNAVRVWGAFRYDGERSFELAVTDPAYRGSGRHGDLAVAWFAQPWLSFSANGGFAQEIGTHLTRGFVGPEVGLPQLFGPRGGVSLGYSEDLGWLAGRNAYLQTSVAPAPRWQTVARVSYFEDAPRDGRRTHEIGLSGYAKAAILSWIQARLSFTARMGLDDIGDGTSPPVGLVASLGVRGEL